MLYLTLNFQSFCKSSNLLSSSLCSFIQCHISHIIEMEKLRKSEQVDERIEELQSYLIALLLCSKQLVCSLIGLRLRSADSARAVSNGFACSTALDVWKPLLLRTTDDSNCLSMPSRIDRIITFSAFSCILSFILISVNGKELHNLKNLRQIFRKLRNKVREFSNIIFNMK